MHRNAQWILERARWRHERDVEQYLTAAGPTDPTHHDVSPGGRAEPAYRPFAVLCYFINRRTRQRYRGYSGGAGGMKGDHEMRDRRFERIEALLYNETVERILEGKNRGEWPLDRDPVNCAEPAALSIALSYQEDPRDMISVAFGNPAKGNPRRLKDPCNNCMIWMPTVVYGYIDRQGHGHRAEGNAFVPDDAILEQIR